MFAVLVVIAVLIAIPSFFGGSIWALASACKALVATCMDQPMLTLPIGLVALVLTLAVTRWAIIATSRRRSGRARGRA